MILTNGTIENVLRVVIFACVVAGLVACENKDENVVQDSEDMVGDVVYADDENIVLLCRCQWSGIKLGKVDPSTYVDNSEWDIPTKEDAIVLKQCTIQDAGKERYLCYDDVSGEYYTFLFNGQGTISKAGMKTAYTLRPVRVISSPKDTIIPL